MPEARGIVCPVCILGIIGDFGATEDDVLELHQNKHENKIDSTVTTYFFGAARPMLLAVLLQIGFLLSGEDAEVQNFGPGRTHGLR